jgi:hypothetical protein
MRISDLLEGKHFNELDFVKNAGEKRELDFDLEEDLIHFMNHDDNVYRRHTYPAIARCLDYKESKRPTKKEIFKPAVESSYKLYTEKFPIRELPDKLDEKLCDKICAKIHEDVLEHISNGKYKD